RAAVSPGELHRFVDGRMFRNALEPKDLVKTQSEQCVDERLLSAAVCLAGDEPIQRGLPAHDAIHQSLAQRAVERRKAGASQSAFEQVFHELPLPATAPNLQRNFSWFLTAQLL